MVFHVTASPLQARAILRAAKNLQGKFWAKKNRDEKSSRLIGVDFTPPTRQNSPNFPMKTLGIIAGNGQFPFLLAQQAKKSGVSRIVAAAFDGETDPDLAKNVDEIEWVKLGQLQKLIEIFKSRGVTQAVMAGQITPANLFKNLRLDLRMMTVAARLKERNAATIFGAIADEMAKDGIELTDPRPFLGDFVPKIGTLTRQKPTKEQLADIEFGKKIAKAVSDLHIGQTVVVKNGTVLAVEGFEGTDDCIKRGGKLAGENGGAVVVKVSKPNHDFRFDMPCIGARTIESCAAGKIAVLAIESGATLLLERDKILKLAAENGIVIVAT
jgi:DUF1009 family protein